MFEETVNIVELLRRAALLPPARALSPVPGDWVVDNTRGCPNAAYVGELEAVERDAQGGPVYIVRSAVTGLPERWTNTDVLTVKPGNRRFEENT